MRIHSKYFPPYIRAFYHIDGLIEEDVYVYIKTIKCMYSLKQAANISYNQLITHMEPHEYYPVPFITGLCSHKSSFFADHLLKSLKNHYVISTDWEGYNCLGLTIDWKHNREYVNISMPEYAKKHLIESIIPSQKYHNMIHIAGQ